MQRFTAWLPRYRHLQEPGSRLSGAFQLVRYQHGTQGSQPKPSTSSEQATGAGEDTTPPSAARAIATMGAGAIGAVAVAAVGVWGVFKMAMAVAEGTGRTLNSNAGSVPAAAVASSSGQGASSLLPMQPDVPAGPVYPPTSQYRKAKLQAELKYLYQLPTSPAVEDQKAAIRQELQSMQ